MGKHLTLIANPGSASRKYALFEDGRSVGSLHFEHEANKVICTLEQGSQKHPLRIDMADMQTAAQHVATLFQTAGVLEPEDKLTRIGLRIVAPSSYFLNNHIMNEEAVEALRDLESRAPIHIGITLRELEQLTQAFPSVPVIGVSDSCFHITKPDRAWNYGLPLHDADRFEIKRFGYHGISCASVVETLIQNKKLTPKLIVVHLGSGASVSAVYHGKSIDTTMGYSPLEGLIMSTRVGSIDVTAARAMQTALGLPDEAFDTYLNKYSGLEGLGGSNDIRELLQREAAGDHQAKLALDTYVLSVQKAIGQMTAALGGIDALVFTGTVGERSSILRQRILETFGYLDFHINKSANERCFEPAQPALISQLARSKPIFVVQTREASHMTKQVNTTVL